MYGTTEIKEWTLTALHISFILQFKKYKIARNESLYDKFYKPLGQRVKLALAFGQYAPIGQSTSVGDVEDSGQ